MKRRIIGLGALAAYAATIVASNWAVAHHAPIPVGFGQVAPAGVLFAGLAFTLRDLGQKLTTWWAVLVAIVAGAGIAAFTSTPALALASAAAFGFSELVDMAVYTPLERRRHWLWAVVLSNTVGALADSLIFLMLAFGSLQFLAGQWLGKFWVTAPFLIVLGVQRIRRARGAVA